MEATCRGKKKGELEKVNSGAKQLTSGGIGDRYMEQEGKGSEAGRPGPGGQQERKEVLVIKPRGWVDLGTLEPLFSRERDPLP